MGFQTARSADRPSRDFRGQAAELFTLSFGLGFAHDLEIHDARVRYRRDTEITLGAVRRAPCKGLASSRGYTTGLPRAELSHDATAGAPAPGCLKLSVPFSGACCDFAEVVVGVATIQDWSRAILHARVRLASGTFTGVAQLLAGAGRS